MLRERDLKMIYSIKLYNFDANYYVRYGVVDNDEAPILF
ncbi:hypothetical protein SAMN05443550_107133 [Pedobacter hartonius]|uniref:Uncharacterized protein n=1 Tax=Pedobacter hartonius TaxID=425514 RepID=A0A1H4FCF3_9SPHI|nr:hypothetical protein SAMN05443550_107133 [Pedobacter hartonius]